MPAADGTPATSSRTAFYPGSFDPLTQGHLDILLQATRLFDRVVVGIGVHSGKMPLFSFDERVALIGETLREEGAALEGRVTVVSFKGLVVDAALDAGAVALVRGLRDGGDLDYEMQMAGMNARLAPDLVTLFLPARPEFRPITATLVRQIAAMGGAVSDFVPGPVSAALRARFPDRQA